MGGEVWVDRVYESSRELDRSLGPSGWVPIGRLRVAYAVRDSQEMYKAVRETQGSMAILNFFLGFVSTSRKREMSRRGGNAIGVRKRYEGDM